MNKTPISPNEQIAATVVAAMTNEKVSCFPVKIKAASAGWTRAVAIID